MKSKQSRLIPHSVARGAAMFESLLADALNKALGQYCEQVDAEKLRVSALRGDVLLRNVQLKRDALRALNAPVTLDAGVIGSLRLKVPWTKLGQEPVVVEIDRVFVLATRVEIDDATEARGGDATSASNSDGVDKNTGDARARSERLAQSEFDWLKASMGKLKRDVENAAVEGGKSKSWMWSLFGTVIGNLQVTVTNVHFRYEDEITTPGNRFACGMTIETLSAITVDDDGNPTFTSSDMLSRIHKHVKLANFAMYLDSGTLSTPWKTHAGWMPPDPKDDAAWWALFGVGLDAEAPSALRHYVLHPVSVDLFYHRKGKKEVSESPNSPRQIFDLRFQDARVALSRKQYFSLMRLLDVLNQFRMRLPHAELRPKVRVKANVQAWWAYAVGALVKRQKKVSGRINWRDIQHASRQRRSYLSMYIAEGGAVSDEITQSVRDIECELDFEVALAWRCIAHSLTRGIPEQEYPSLAAQARAQVKDAIARESAPRSSYSLLPWRWSSKKEAENSIAEDSDLQMTDSDWSKLDEVMGVSASVEDEGDLSALGIEFKGQMRRVSWELKDHDEHNVERLVMSSSMRGAHIASKSYGDHAETTLSIDAWTCDTTSERILVSGESGASALKVEHHSYPLEHELDASVDVKVAPVYIIFEHGTIDQLTNFFSSTDTPQANLTSLQDQAVEKIEMAKKNTTAALTKISMNFEIDAPKVTIPVRHSGRVVFQTLVDFGHFTFIADPRVDYATVDRKTGAPAYHTFAIKGTDMAVFLADSSFDWKSAPEVDLSSVCEPILAPCEANVHLNAQGPGWTRESGAKSTATMTTANVQTYISPTKLARIYATMQAAMTSTQPMALNNSVAEVSVVDVKPWHGTLLNGASSAMKVGLVGAASGYHGRWLSVNGPYLYILDNPNAVAYVDYVRIGANVRVSVLDEESDGDSDAGGPVLAIHDAKVPKSRAAGTNNTWLLRFTNDVEYSKWQRWLGDLNETALATGRLAKVETESEDASPLATHEANDGVNFVLNMSFGDLRVHLSGQPMGTAGVLCDGLENGGVARALNRDLKDSTEVPLATLVAQSANIAIESTESSRSFNFTVSTLDIVDELCDLSDTFCMVSAKPKSVTQDFKVQLNYKQLSTSSPEYDNVDTELSLDTENIVVTIHRPTIGSIWRMWEEIKIVLAAFSTPLPEEIKKTPSFDSLIAGDSNRVGFKLLLHFESTIIKAFREQRAGEVGLQPLFDCHMDDLTLDMRGKSAATEIAIALGNLCVTDRSLPEDNAYRHFIDLKSSGDNSSTTSQTHVDVLMYNHLSSTFPGYEYDIRVKSDNVKVIVVYAFVQKLLGFFSGFLPPPIPISALPESERNAELLRRGEPRPFTMVYAVDLTKPEVVVPRSSASQQALSLDVELLRAQNSLEWTSGKSHRDFGSVLMDTTKVSLVQFSMCIRDQHEKRPSMMPGCKASVDVAIRKPKWDANGRAPGLEMIVDITDEVAFEIDDGEYRILRALTAENFSEETDIPQSLYEFSQELEQLKSVDRVTVLDVPKSLMAVHVNKVQMTIFGGLRTSRFKAIGAFEIANMHVGLKRNLNDELAMTVTCPNLELRDLRAGTPLKAQQVFGSSSRSVEQKTLFQVDVIMTQSLIDVNALLQSCRMMHDPQFALAVYNFFTLTSDNESESGLVNARLTQDLDFGDRDTLTLDADTELNASRRILCDSPFGQRTIELRGAGHELVFRVNGAPLVHIAAGRSLTLSDVRIVLPIGSQLSDFVHLEPDAQLIADESNEVRVVYETRASASQEDLTLENDVKPPMELRVQASAPELQVMFLDAAVVDDEYMLRVRTDVEFNYSSVAGLKEGAFALSQFQVAVSEWSKAGNIMDASVILKPLDLDGRIRAASDDIELMIRSTNVNIVLDAQSIQRVLSISKGFKTTLQSTGLYNQTASCSQFTRMGSVDNGMNFWRPVPPPGFAFVGDCVTMSDAPPSRPVTVVTDAEGLTKLPSSYERVCALNTPQQGSRVVVWRPVAPDGFHALGCVVTVDDVEPPLEAMRCVRAEVVCTAYYGACISSRTSNAQIHIVHNSSSTFQASVDGSSPAIPMDLRNPLLPASAQSTAVAATLQDHSLDDDASRDGLRTLTTYDLMCVWSDADERGSRQASIWRPKAPTGYASLGDCLISGRDPPSAGVLVVDMESGGAAHPNGYVLVGSIAQGSHENGDHRTFAVWHPLPPNGYSACGDLVTTELKTPPALTSCACVRNDLLVKVSRNGTCADSAQASYDAIFVEMPLWVDDVRDPRCALWSSDPDAPLEHLPRWGLFQYSNKSNSSPTQYRPRFSVVDYVQKRELTTSKKVNVSMKLSIPLLSAVLLEREAYSQPLFCATISDTVLVINGTSAKMDGNTMFTAAASSYDTVHDAWEPIVDPTNAYLKFSYSLTGDDSRPAGVALQVKTIVPLSVSISRNFIAAFLRWKTWHSQSVLEAQQKIEHCALDENSILYENRLINQDVYLRVGNSYANVVCVKPTEVKEIIVHAHHVSAYVLPIDMSQSMAQSKGDAEWPVRSAWHAILHIESATFADVNDLAQVVTKVEFSFPDGLRASDVHTRAVSPVSGPADARVVMWREAFHIVPRVSRESAPLLWREYADDILVTFTIIDQHQVKQEATSIATRSMTLTALLTALDMSSASLGQGTVKIPCVDGDKSVDMTIHLEVQVDTQRSTVDAMKDATDTDDSLVYVAFTPDGPWQTISARETSQVIVCDNSRCVVSSTGLKSYTFEPVVSFTNNTSDAIEVYICPLGSHPDDGVGQQSRKKSTKCIEEIFENERFMPFAGWSSKHLMPTERKTWSSRNGSGSVASISDVERDLLPPNYSWQGAWEVNVLNETDKEGWAYATSFPDLKFPFHSGHGPGPMSFVRMRRWIRTRALTVQPAEIVATPKAAAALRQRVVVKPGESAGLISAVVGPVAQSELFMRTITSKGPSEWGVDVDSPEGGAWACMISGAMEGSEVTRVVDPTGVHRFIGVQVEAVAVTSDASAEKASYCGGNDDDDDDVELFTIDASAMSWRVVAVPPHRIVNESPRTATVTMYQGEINAPLVAKAISMATVTPGSSLAVHAVHPDLPYYLKVALDDGFDAMVPKNRLLPISPLSVQAIAEAKSADSFDIFNPTASSSSDDKDESIDVITLASADGRTAVLDVRHDFGFLSRAPRVTTLSAPVLIMNKSGVDLVIRTSTISSTSAADDDVVASTVKFCQTRAPQSTRGIQILRECAIRKAPRENEMLLLELGIAAAAKDLKLSPGISVDERELLRGAVVVRARCPDESIYSLTVRMESNSASKSSAFSSQVIIIEPHYVLTNQTGDDVLIAQAATPESSAVTLRAADANVPLKMRTAANDGIVCIKLPNSSWSAPIRLHSITDTALKIPVYSSAHPDEFQLLSLHANVSTLGVSKIRVSVESRAQAAIIVENASDVDVIAFRQAGAMNDDVEPWRLVPPRCAKPFAWARPLDAQKLNVCVVHNGSIQNVAYRTYDFENLDLSTAEEVLPALPKPKIDLGEGVMQNLDIDGGDGVYFDFLPVARVHRRGVRIIRVDAVSATALKKRNRAVKGMEEKSTEIRFSMSVGECSVALVDAAASEIINCSAGGLGVDVLTGVSAGVSRLALAINWLQIDDMKTGSAFPVIMRVLSKNLRKHTLFSMTMVTKTSADLGVRVYPYVDVNFAPRPIQVAAHEPLVWRLVDFARVFEQDDGAAAGLATNETRLERVDVPIAIGTLAVSALHLRLRFRSALYARPKRAMPAFLVGVSFVNIDNSPLHLEPFRVAEVRALERAFWTTIKDSYMRQVARQALALLAGVDVLDSFSQALGQASAGMAQLSFDKKFSTSMKKTLGGAEAQKADSIKTGITTGSEMLAKGVFRGVTGVFQKPIEGAMKGGAVGFAKGVGKGLVGAVTQPLAGGLAAVGRTAEGIAVGFDSVKSTLGVTALAPQHRVRHPRAEYADGVLRSWQRESSEAQRALATAVRGSLAGGSNHASQVFTHKGYYARDKYIASLDVNAKTLLVVLTNERVVAFERKPTPDGDQYVALWHAGWDELADVVVEEPARVVLQLKEFRKTRVFDKMKTARVVQCTPATQQAQVLAGMIRKELDARQSERQSL